MSETKHSLWTRLFRGETAFDFVGRRKRWFAISGTIIAIGLIALLVRGLNFGIEFKGGTVWEVRSNASVARVRDTIGQISPDLRQATIEVLTDRQTGAHTIRVSAHANTTKDKTKVNQVSAALAKLGGVDVNQVTLNDVGPTWGHDITQKAIRALVIFLFAVVIYITFRFEGKMAIAALIALVHDILVTIGVYSISGFQVSPATVIAFLTILGYSLYDTIVVFDKIEENTKGLASSGRITYTETVNLSMNQVLMRSINTSVVAIMPILSILLIGAYFLGASALEDFGLALFIGLLTGAYSSIFIAAPVLAVMKEREPRYSQIRQRLANRASMTGVLTPAAAAAGDLFGAAAGSAGGGGGGRSKAGPGARAGASGSGAGGRGAGARSGAGARGGASSRSGAGAGAGSGAGAGGGGASSRSGAGAGAGSGAGAGGGGARAAGGGSAGGGGGGAGAAGGGGAGARTGTGAGARSGVGAGSGARAGGTGAGSGAGGRGAGGSSVGGSSGGGSSAAGGRSDGGAGGVGGRGRGGRGSRGAGRPVASPKAGAKQAIAPNKSTPTKSNGALSDDGADEIDVDAGADLSDANVPSAPVAAGYEGKPKAGAPGNGAPASAAPTAPALPSAPADSRPAPKPRPGASNRSGGGGRGGNRAAPRPRKKGRRR